MRNCFKRLHRPLTAVFAAGMMILGAGCTDVDDTMGLELLPDEQHMDIGMATIFSGVDTYTRLADSIATNNLTRGLIGSLYWEEYGLTTCGMIVHYAPYIYPDSDVDASKQMVADSLVFSIQVNNVYVKGNDKNKRQTFHAYQLTDTVSYSSDMYSTYNAAMLEELVDFSEPVFTFEIENMAPGYIINKTIYPDQSPRTAAYMEELAQARSLSFEGITNKNAEFRSLMKGLYITPDPSITAQEAEGMAVYDIQLTPTYYYDYTSLYLWGTRPGGDGEDAFVKDSMVCVMWDAKPDYYSYNHPNLSATIVKHDYTTPGCLVDPSRFVALDGNGNIPEGTPTQQTVFVQGMGGVGTYLHFNDVLLDHIRGLMTRDGVTYGSIVINQAELYIQVDDIEGESDADVFSAAPQRMGMYNKMNSYYLNDDGSLTYSQTYMGSPEPIRDYLYTVESSYSVPYGGYLNRTKGYYKMDISMYLRALINQEIHDPEGTDDDDKVKRNIWLAPSAGTTSLLGPGRVALKGSGSDDEVRIKLIYTLVKE